MLDGHAHICDSVFDDDRDEVLVRAEKAGVSAIIAVGENLSDAHKNLQLANRYPMLKPAAGLYPTILDTGQAEEIIALIRKNRPRLAAIGEVGLDYWVVTDDREKAQQREIFCQFIAPVFDERVPILYCFCLASSEPIVGEEKAPLSIVHNRDETS